MRTMSTFTLVGVLVNLVDAFFVFKTAGMCSAFLPGVSRGSGRFRFMIDDCMGSVMLVLMVFLVFCCLCPCLPGRVVKRLEVSG